MGGFSAENSDLIKQECETYRSVTCNPQDKYRTADGSCNNKVINENQILSSPSQAGLMW